MEWKNNAFLPSPYVLILYLKLQWRTNQGYHGTLFIIIQELNGNLKTKSILLNLKISYCPMFVFYFWYRITILCFIFPILCSCVYYLNIQISHISKTIYDDMGCIKITMNHNASFKNTKDWKTILWSFYCIEIKTWPFSFIANGGI